MKKLIVALLAMTLMLTAFVACGGDDADNASSANDNKVDAVKPNDSSSVQSLTSDQLDAWGDVSIGFESGDSTYGDETSSNDGNTTSNDTVTSDTSSDSASSTDSTTSTGNSATSTTGSATGSKNNNTSSYDKDQGFDPWIPIP